MQLLVLENLIYSVLYIRHGDQVKKCKCISATKDCSKSMTSLFPRKSEDALESKLVILLENCTEQVHFTRDMWHVNALLHCKFVIADGIIR